jgi:hypothetical protein
MVICCPPPETEEKIMTYQEATERLRSIKEDRSLEKQAGDDEALDIAIKVLSELSEHQN